MSQRRAAAEFLGPFLLVFGGVGSEVIAGEVIGAEWVQAIANHSAGA